MEKKKIDKLEFIKIKSSCALKDTLKDVKIQATDQVKPLTIYMRI